MKVAFICDSITTAPAEFIPLASYFESNNIKSYLFFEKMNAKVFSQLKATGVDYYINDTFCTDYEYITKINDTKHNRMYKILPEFISLYLKLKRQRAMYLNIFRKENFDCIILYNDRTLKLVPAVISIV